MNMEIVEEPVTMLSEYGTVPISFVVKSRLRVDAVAGGLGGLNLVEEPVTPYLKDYDADMDEAPTRWLKRWDIAHWGLLAAYEGAQRIGGAVVAWRTPGVNMLEGRDDLAVLWDLRVHPDHRGKGVGHALFTRTFNWARERGLRQLKIETQNINVAACRFYARQGCELGAINRYAYKDYPDEVQMLWYITL